MIDQVAKRREISRKIAAAIPRLKTEIDDRRRNMAKARERLLAKPARINDGCWFAAWSRHVDPIAKAVASLDRALRRLPLALEREEDAVTRLRERDALLDRIRRANEGYARTMPSADELAASTKRRTKERRDEEKRVQRLKNKFKAAEPPAELPNWMRRPRTLPPPILQPDLTEDDGDVIAPPRPDLLPGTFAVKKPDRVGALLDLDPLPDRWTWQHVGNRLIEAHAIFKRLPASMKPKGMSTAWPGFQLSPADIEDAIPPSVTVERYVAPEEISRAEEAIQWPMQFLSNEPWRASDVNHWAMTAIEATATPQTPTEILERIASALNAANEVVR